MRTVFLDGRFVPENEAKVSVFDRGFLFADAIYEVVSVLDRKLIDFSGHMKRLKRSLSELSITCPIGDAQWLEIMWQLVADNNLSEGVIYLQITRGNPGDRSFFWPSADTAPTVTAFTQSMPLIANPALDKGLAIITLPDLRWGRADIKTTQLLYASMMKMEAKAHGGDDAWLVRDGVVGEGTSQNAHIITQDGRLVTHQLDRNILHGITREAVLDLAGASSLTVEERAFSVEEAKAASEAFVSAASAFILPVTAIDGAVIGNGKPGKVTLALREAYIAWARRHAI